jgi:hypothetical protein
MASIDALRNGREYAVAWELEVWKQAQEAKWTAEMRAREAGPNRSISLCLTLSCLSHLLINLYVSVLYFKSNDLALL